MTPHTSTSRRSSAARFAVALLLALGATVVGAAGASAHGDKGLLAVESATVAGTTAQVTAKVSFLDGDPAAGATVTVAGDNGAGATLAPVTLPAAANTGQYSGAVALPAPGTWTLRVTSVDPTAEAAPTQVVVAAPSATTTSAPTGVPVTTSPVTSDGGVPEITADDDTSTDDGGVSPVWWVLGGIAVVAAVATGIIFVARGRNQGPID